MLNKFYVETFFFFLNYHQLACVGSRTSLFVTKTKNKPESHTKTKTNYQESK